MAQAVESALGVSQPDRAMEPRDDAEGPFDPESASLYDILKREENGQTTYERVFVDASGRTLRERVEAEHMTPADLRAVTVFQMARDNPNLRFLVDAVRGFAESHAGGEREE